MARIDANQQPNVHDDHCDCAGCGAETFTLQACAVFWLGYCCVMRWPRLAGAMLSAVKRWNAHKRRIAEAADGGNA